jgi:hypothetical protein
MGLSIWDGLPRTIQFEIHEWQNKSWGLHNVDRRKVICETAISNDGSRMNKCGYTDFRYWVIQKGSGSDRTLYVRPTNVGYAIDDANHTATGGDCKC